MLIVTSINSPCKSISLILCSFLCVVVYFNLVQGRTEKKHSEGEGGGPMSSIASDPIVHWILDVDNNRFPVQLYRHFVDKLFTLKSKFVGFWRFQLSFINGLSYKIQVMNSTFELITAILAGSNSLELRIFAPDEMPSETEQPLTRRLCRLMDIFYNDWRV